MSVNETLEGTYPYRSLPINQVFSALELPKGYLEELDLAEQRILDSPGWREWLTAHVGPDDGTAPGIHILYIEDRDTRRIMVRGDSLYFYEPATAIANAAKTGRMLEHYLELFTTLYKRWAEKKKLPEPPSVT